MDQIAGRIAVVTGGGEGIGRGIAHALAAEGAIVAVADIDLAAAERVATELRDSGATARAFRADVAAAPAMETLAHDVETALGPVSILCNNAGVMLDGPLVGARASDWQWVLSVNLMGVIHGVQAFVPRMRANGIAGHIVNTGSMAGLAPRLGMRLGIYSASKAAVVSYSEMLRSELAEEGMGVSVLCPSTVNTRIWEADRNRQAEFGEGWPVPKPGRVANAIDGMDVGPLVVRGIREDRAYIFTSDDARPRVEERHARILADIERG
jgi:NAD(P)-dependent dehydrogenase (short-subunit alcohol dehydrogenase family)